MTAVWKPERGPPTMLDVRSWEDANLRLGGAAVLHTLLEARQQGGELRIIAMYADCDDDDMQAEAAAASGPNSWDVDVLGPILVLAAFVPAGRASGRSEVLVPLPLVLDVARAFPGERGDRSGGLDGMEPGLASALRRDWRAAVQLWLASGSGSA